MANRRKDIHKPTKKGYIRLRRDGVAKMEHVMVWEKHYGKIPDGHQIHHIDGDTKNNTLENLIMICPNCHAQTENYRGNANVKVEKPKNYCVDCGREIGRTSIRCLSCASKAKVGVNTNFNMTEDKYKEYKRNGYPDTKIALMYGVTENTVRKWRKSHGF